MKIEMVQKSEVKNWVGTLFSISVQKYNGIYYKTGIAHGWKPMTRLEKVGSFTETLEETQITDR